MLRAFSGEIEVAIYGARALIKSTLYEMDSFFKIAAMDVPGREFGLILSLICVRQSNRYEIVVSPNSCAISFPDNPSGRNDLTSRNASDLPDGLARLRPARIDLNSVSRSKDLSCSAAPEPGVDEGFRLVAFDGDNCDGASPGSLLYEDAGRTRDSVLGTTPFIASVGIVEAVTDGCCS